MAKLTDPCFMRKVMAWLTVAFIVLIPVAHVTGMVKSIIFVNDLSLIALVLSAGAWWAAASGEARQIEEDPAGDVVEKIVDQTQLERQ